MTTQEALAVLENTTSDAYDFAWGGKPGEEKYTESRNALAVLKSAIEERDALKAEVERLRRQVEIEQRKVSDLDGLLAKYHEAAEQAEAELAAARPIIEVAKELLETADLRGDSVLPLPPDDPKPWSAHAQTVWNALRAALAHKEAKDKP